MLKNTFIIEIINEHLFKLMTRFPLESPRLLNYCLLVCKTIENVVNDIIDDRCRHANATRCFFHSWVVSCVITTLLSCWERAVVKCDDTAAICCKIIVIFLHCFIIVDLTKIGRKSVKHASTTHWIFNISNVSCLNNRRQRLWAIKDY